MGHKKPNWNFAPPDAEAGCAEGPQHFAAWYKRDGKGNVWQICEGAGACKWTWMGGRVDFPIPHELRPENRKSVSRSDLVFAALVDCVSVMEKELNGLALIQTELKQAKQAIDAYQVVDAEFFEWDGEGLPPPGTACELRVLPHGEWGAAMICFSSANVFVWDWAEEPAVNGKCTAYAHTVEIRPVSWTDHAPSKDREKAVKELFFTINWQATEAEWDSISNDRKCDYAKAIEAGYRKQVAP